MAGRNSAVALAIFACATAYGAQSVTNKKYGYRVSIPDGWTVMESLEEPGETVALLEGDKGVPLCLISAEESQIPHGKNQAEINEYMRQPFSKEFWLEASSPEFKNPSVESNVSRLHPSGLQSQESVIAYKDAVSGEAMKIKMAYMRAVKTTYAITCGAESKSFVKHAPAFDSIVETFAPKEGNFADLNPPPNSNAQSVSARTPDPKIREQISAAALRFSKSKNAAVNGVVKQ